MKRALFIAAAFLCSALPSPELDACTGVMLTAKDNTAVHGRTAEFGVQLQLSMTVIPRGYDFVGTIPQGKGMKYKAKYGCVGAIAFSNMAILDGMNEKGLSVGAFYFPGYASYGTVTAKNQARALSPVDFPNWILTQFATIDEVKAALSTIVIAPTVLSGWGTTPPPFHYIVYEKNGDCLVIEPMQGTLVTYDNPIGVITNSPDFNWHLTNLRNYIHLTSINVPPLKIDGMVFPPFSQGSGLVGLPGDFTSPSRFVQATVFQVTAMQPQTANDGVFQLFHILNHFDIPIGSVRQPNGKEAPTNEWTLLTCVRDPANLQYYFKTYEDQTLKVIDLMSFDLNATTPKSLVVWKDTQSLINVTQELE